MTGEGRVHAQGAGQARQPATVVGDVTDDGAPGTT